MNLGKNADVKLQRLGKVSLEVLDALGQIGLIAGAEMGDFVLDITQRKSINQAIYPSRTKRITESLKQTGLIRGNESQGYQITAQGRWELARRRRLDTPERHTPSRWDHKWRVVIFDIPELERSQRDMLRRAITGYGMYQLQQSVWVYPYPCESFIQSIKQDLGFRSEVLSMVVDSIENQIELEREFALKQ